MSDLSFHLEVYDGPLDLLLGLITKNKLAASNRLHGKNPTSRGGGV